MSNTYNHIIYKEGRWNAKRLHIFERDNYTCVKCHKKKDIKDLCCHHIQYEKDKHPADYPDSYLQTLCKGCHAEEHGKIPPQRGWSYVDSYDCDKYGDEQCEMCGEDLLHVYTIYHPNWGFLNVGCNCADRLQESEDFSDTYKEQIKFKKFCDRIRCYSNSDGSISSNKILFYKRILIMFKSENSLIVYFHNKKNNITHIDKTFEDIAEQKISIYESIKDGSLNDFIHKKVWPFSRDKYKRVQIMRYIGISTYHKSSIISK